MVKRLLSLDFIRGLAIFGVVMIHAIIFGIMINDNNARNLIPKSPLVILAPILLLGTWAGIFALITGIINGYQVFLKMKKNEDIRLALRGGLINSTIVLLMHFLYMGIFSRGTSSIASNGINYSLLTGSIQLQQLNFPPFEIFFTSDALAMIAGSGYFSILILWLLWRKGNFNNSKRNIKILIEIGVIWLAISKPLWDILYPIFINFLDKGGLYYIPAMILSLISGNMHSLLPYGAYAIFGMILGIFLAENKKIEEIKSFCKKIGISLIFFALLLTIYHIFTVEESLLKFFFEYKMIPPDLYLLNLGIMILWLPWFFEKFDYCSDEERMKIIQKTIFIRRFGIISLTVYFLEPVWDCFWSYIFHSNLGNLSGEPDLVMNSFVINLLYILLIFGSWTIGLKIWEKYKFKYSFEWFSVRIGMKLGKKSSDRLDLTNILYPNKLVPNRL